MTDAQSIHHVVLTATVAGSIEACFKVATDVESYPEWVDSIESVFVKERSDDLPILATFSAESFGRKSDYTLSYDLSEAPNKLSWSLVEGDLVREIEGSYTFATSESSAQETDVSYSLKIDVAVPLPAFVKRRAEERILESALAKFKERVETLN